LWECFAAEVTDKVNFLRILRLLIIPNSQGNEIETSGDGEAEIDMYGQNQMTQSTCTTSTSVTLDSSPSDNYSNFPTLPMARQRLGGHFPQSNV
jgi:hypothetical protein